MPATRSQRPLYWVPYTLHAPAPPSRSSSRQEFPGALIRAGSGFGCIHPWPELGDLPLEDQLGALAANVPDVLGRRALDCAEIDGIARENGRSLFDGLTIPESHGTAASFTTSTLRSLHEAGFSAAKCKAGASDLNSLSACLSNSPLPLRIDFNEAFTTNELDAFLSELKPAGAERINFLEDPFPFDQDSWTAFASRWNITLAVDKQVETGWPSAAVAILKPARHDAAGLAPVLQAAGKRAVVTSYLDHPLGQLFAAWQAAVINASFPGLLDLCGLVTHPLFERNLFSECLPDGPQLVPPPGTGLGFDDLLERLPWKRLR